MKNKRSIRQLFLFRYGVDNKPSVLLAHRRSTAVSLKTTELFYSCTRIHFFQQVVVASLSIFLTLYDILVLLL